MARKLRDIRRTSQYETDCLRISPDLSTMADAEAALDFFIARADFFAESDVMPVKIPHTDVYAVRLDESFALPSLRAYYQLDGEDFADLLAIEAVQDDDESTDV